MKTIVICCDGTGNKFGKTNTNVIKLLQAIDYSSDVVTFYDTGVGTFAYQGAFADVTSWIGNFVRQAFGKGVRKKIQNAYRLLMDCYEPGDKVYIYGFSRGAFTARSLAGLLHDYGLLKPELSNLVKQVSRMYHRGKKSNQNKKGVPDDVRHEFQRLFTQPCKPTLIGVWDTVGSLGILYKGEKFTNSKLNKDVKVGLHAMAIHETRRKFPISIWSNELDSDGITRRDSEGIIKQVWFAGVHSDVGGGYEETGLSDIALKWMLRESESANLPVRTDWQSCIWPPYMPNEAIERHDEFWTWKWIWMGWKNRQIAENSMVHESAKGWANANNVSLKLPKSVTYVP